jgi:transglutaminase-like putative cysteine protease
MRIRVRHTTSYSYTSHVEYEAQALRLAPRNHAGQRVLSWRVTDMAGRALPATDDGYGNVVHLLTIVRSHREAGVIAEGEVETSDTHGIVREAPETLPVSYWRRTTDATTPDAALRQLAAEVEGVADRIERLHRLMALVRQRIDYVIGHTDATTTAAEALAHAKGVCQDHAHVFITCARLLGYPARYVSGYLWTSDQIASGEAGHAWAEAHVPDLGWIGFDPANNTCPTEAYVRMAIGLDYGEAAPVRGVRRGGRAEEKLVVAVDVLSSQAQQ